MPHRDQPGSARTPDLNQVIGRRLRQFRLEHRLSQDGLAVHLQRWGLDWDRATVGRKEAGQRKFTADELLVLCVALNCRLVDLIKAETVRLPETDVTYAAEPGTLLYQVALGERPFPEFSGLPRVQAGPRPPVEDYLRDLAEKRHSMIERIWPKAKPNIVGIAELSARNDAERNAARRLGVDPFEVALLSIKLWNATFEAARNERAARKLGYVDNPEWELEGPENRVDVDQAALNVHRAHAARELIEELRGALGKLDA